LSTTSAKSSSKPVQQKYPGRISPHNGGHSQQHAVTGAGRRVLVMRVVLVLDSRQVVVILNTSGSHRPTVLESSSSGQQTSQLLLWRELAPKGCLLVEGIRHHLVRPGTAGEGLPGAGFLVREG